MSEPEQTPTLAERLREIATFLALHGEDELVGRTTRYPHEYLNEAAAEIDRLTAAERAAVANFENLAKEHTALVRERDALSGMMEREGMARDRAEERASEFDSVGLWQDKPQHNWADCARVTVDALREQLKLSERSSTNVINALREQAGRLAVSARELLDAKFWTYKSGRHEVSVEGNDGEKCWIVPSEKVDALEDALASSLTLAAEHRAREEVVRAASAWHAASRAIIDANMSSGKSIAHLYEARDKAGRALHEAVDALAALRKAEDTKI